MIAILFEVLYKNNFKKEIHHFEGLDGELRRALTLEHNMWVHTDIS